MKTNLHSAFSSVVEKMGYVVYPTWKMNDLALEQHLAKLFDHYGITVVLDIGANAGQYRDFLRHRVGFSGTIHSFEPNPQLVSKLMARGTEDPLWTIHNMGLGHENGNLTLNIMARDTFSSFRNPDNSATLKFASSNTIVDTASVPVRRLDDLIADLVDLDRECCYMKVDTQGFDIEVLRGANRTLEKTKAMQFELAVQRIYSDVPHHLDMLKTVENHGYDLSGMFPISQDEHLRAVEFDCVMVKHPTNLVNSQIA
ncbi:FkbM family methyltransferase [Dechloromonas sp. A34]|uniref:FkbM family methyltransferase n=1 Tax=Dechloromonas sp. A34 TaxID=447588 RepID=UPI002249015A|nr:FkbM family methyltransferase [Dechloromonas sp. A34]